MQTRLFQYGHRQSSRGTGLIAAATLFWAGAICWSAATSAAVEDFSRYPKYELVRISPKGNYIAVTHREDDTESLSILKLPGLELASTTKFTHNTGISNVIWATEERLLLQPARRFPARQDFEVPTGEIAAMDVDGTNAEMLFGYRAGEGQLGIHTRKRTSTRAAAEIIDMLPEDPHNVIIQTIGYGVQGARNEALLLNITDGRTRQLAHSPIRNGRFLTDSDHSVNLVAGLNEAGDYQVYLRRGGKGAFERVYSSRFGEGSLKPIMDAGVDGYYLFTDSASAPTRGLISWNPVTDDKISLFRHDNVDLDRFYVAPHPKVWAVRYVDHYPKYHYPDSNHPYVVLHQSLLASFPEDDVRIIDQTDDLSLAVVYVTGPQNPGTFYILDTVNKTLNHRLDTRPWLNGRTLAAMEPIEVTARDGLIIRGYLTLPPGQNQNLPLVVLVHGGPYGIADSWGFHYEVQLLAEHGYAVLQVNFRGSGGRGQEFLRAGFGKWGQEMQNDVTDSVRYLIAQGTADAERLCIFGASYGAYSALVGAYRDPDLYRCAIGYAGIYDLPLMFRQGDTQQVLKGVNFLKSAIGTDEAEQRRRSPAFNASLIKARVMLIHGKLDERAPFEHARRMRKALIEAGNAPEWLVENREGHGFARENNRLEMYTRILAFLDDNLK